MNRIDHFAANPDDKHIEIDFVGWFQRGSDAVVLHGESDRWFNIRLRRVVSRVILYA